jgi:hypothetical protein
MPSWISIPHDHVYSSGRDDLYAPFKKNEHYFAVRINEMYLTEERRWFTEFDPMVFAVAEFLTH